MMKALGIVRKIDELGRVVIPKEVRRTHGWEDGAHMEMFISEDGLVIREYGAAEKKKALISNLNDVLEMTDNEAVMKIVGNAIDFIQSK